MNLIRMAQGEKPVLSDWKSLGPFCIKGGVMFVKYQHVERFGSSEVDGIVDLVDPCFVFPKLDGTNGSVWLGKEGLCFGSRNRKLSLENDNQGFMTELHTNLPLLSFFANHPNLRLFGEWLVPHTLKTYEENAWRQFYVFDVMVGAEYIPYDDYKTILDDYAIKYLAPMAIVERGTEEQFLKCLDSNTYLMQQGELGEGVVIKRYGFKNRYGRTTWAKIVRSGFKTKHCKTMGPQVFNATAMVEEKIVIDFVSKSMVDKIHAKIVGETGFWESKFIPRLLHTVFYDLIREECWNFVKAQKNPTVDFGALQRFTYARVKTIKPELF